MPLSAGQVFRNRYRIERTLGMGGFGAVYQAWDTNLDEAVAIKESFDAIPDNEKRFWQEAKLLFRLRHSNLPRVIDHFSQQNSTGDSRYSYLIMDYIDGEDLRTKLEKTQGPLPVEDVLSWLDQVCDALIYLHTQEPPIIHRDVKPANIRITGVTSPRMKRGQAVLVDFGIAKVFDPDSPTTTSGQAITPGYSSPEQYGLGKTDPQSDVYSLAATSYHLLTGKLPPSAMEVSSGVTPPAAPPHTINPEVPEHISLAVVQALKLNRSERTTSVEEFRRQLAGLPPPTNETASQNVSDGVATSLHPASEAGKPSAVPAKVQISPPAKPRSAWRLALFLILGASAGFIAYTQIAGYLHISPPSPTLPLEAVASTSTPTHIPTKPPTSTLPPATPSPTLAWTATIPLGIPPTLPPDILALFISTITPQPGVRFSSITFSESLDASSRPLDPGTTFNAPLDQMFGLFSFDRLNSGVQLTALWLRNGRIVFFETSPWNGSASGVTYTSWAPGAHEWLPGLYEVRIFAGEAFGISGAFTVVGDAPTPNASRTATQSDTDRRRVKPGWPVIRPSDTN